MAKKFIFFPNQNISIMISFPGVFCESFDKLLIPLPLCFVKQEDRPNPIRVRRDRLLTHLEKKNLT